MQKNWKFPRKAKFGQKLRVCRKMNALTSLCCMNNEQIYALKCDRRAKIVQNCYVCPGPRLQGKIHLFLG